MKNTILFVAASFAACGAIHAATLLDVTSDHANALYRLGEEAVFTVTARADKGKLDRSGKFELRLDNFGSEVLSKVQADLSVTNVWTLKGTLTSPGFLRLHSDGDKAAGVRQVNFGVGFEPEKIKPAAECPADFDEFWSAARKKLEDEVPLDPRLELVPELSNDKWDYYNVSFATFGRRVYGYLSVPKDKSKAPYPVLVQVPGAGCGTWSNRMNGSPDSINLFMSVFPWQPQYDFKPLTAKYDALNRDLSAKHSCGYYPQAGIAESREAYFYYPVILGINRAVDWVAARPDADLGSFMYNGTSQGGGFGLFLCALNRHFTAATVYVPAITGHFGPASHGRQSGWPQIVENQSEANRAAAERNAPYFDGVNFARRIKCPVRMTVGFADVTCAPHAVYSAFNVLGCADKEIWHGIGMGHGVYGELYARGDQWRASRRVQKKSATWRPKVRWRGFNLLGLFYKRPDATPSFPEEDFEFMSEFGFNFARIPMDYRWWIKNNDWNEIDGDFLNLLDDMIARARKRKIHVQLCFHRAPGYTVARPMEERDLFTDPEAQRVCCRHWAYFARRYKGIPNEELSFDLFNEPAIIEHSKYDKVARMLVDAIRAEDPDRFIMADGTRWGRVPVKELMDVRNLGQAARGYDPHAVSHYKAEWVSQTNAAMPTWPPTGDIEGLRRYADNGRETLWRDVFSPWHATMMANDIFCMVGECGCYNKTPHAVFLDWFEDNLQIWQEFDIGWALWNLRGSFGVLDSERSDVEYEDWHGHKLDRALLDLLRRY